jgi:hypothetical protein
MSYRIFDLIKNIFGYNNFLDYDLNYVKNFILTKIKEAKIDNINSINFNYIEINELFPLDYYLNFTKFVKWATPILKHHKMVAEDSTNKLYLDVLTLKNVDKIDNKIIINYLTDFKEIIKLISKELFQKFEDQNLVPSYLKGLPTEKPFGQILVREDKSFSINPHLHGKLEILDCLYYFPNTSDDITQGTVIYKKISDEVPNFLTGKPSAAGDSGKVGIRDGYENFDYKYFQEVKRFDYTPNRIIAWLNNSHSFHGANPVATPMTENKKYIFFGLLSGLESVKLMENW